jgi:hypothetical protein
VIAVLRNLIPDLDDDLVDALVQIEELLIALDGRLDSGLPPGEEIPLPVPFCDGAAREACGRLWEAIAPTQSSRGVQVGPRMLGPNGYEHVPLRHVVFDPDDVQLLEQAGQLLALALHDAPIPDADPHAGEALRGALEEIATPPGPATTPQDLIVLIARITGLLDLTFTPDTDRLQALMDAAGDVDIRFDPVGEAAYQRTVDRLNMMWTSGNPLDRWTY